ncbi:Uncharacterised protein [Vibrio cholerae]|nr:Uncharacterised protein [Vibrio cholerae]CSC86433.1 Uncharacterised protein [Vibrio cholerae]
MIGNQLLAIQISFGQIVQRCQVAARVLGFGGADNAPISKTQFAVRATANPEVVTKAPIVEVVLALIARLAVARNLILHIPCITELLMS